MQLTNQRPGTITAYNVQDKLVTVGMQDLDLDMQVEIRHALTPFNIPRYTLCVTLTFNKIISILVILNVSH